MKLAKSLDRLGTETAFSVLAEAKKLEAKGKPMIHLGLGQPDLTLNMLLMLQRKHWMMDIMDMYVKRNSRM